MNAYSFLIGSLILLSVLLIKGLPAFKFDCSAWPQVVYLSVLSPVLLILFILWAWFVPAPAAVLWFSF